MKKMHALALFSLLASHLPLSQAADVTALEAEAKSHIQHFAGELKGTLQQGMKTGGITHAITQCNIEAPKITAKHSADKWTLSRTALKTRNTDNAPSDWQQAILQDFETRKSNGETVDTLSHSETRNGRFYYIKAIPTGAVCTVCHGEKIAPELQTQLSTLYPQDRATGFKAGDIRGAFIISKALETKDKR